MFPKKKKKTLSKQFDAYRREIFFLSKVHKVMQRSHLPPNLSPEFSTKNSQPSFLSFLHRLHFQFIIIIIFFYTNGLLVHYLSVGGDKMSVNR